MNATMRYLTSLILPVALLAGCASDGPPVSDPAQGVSGRKHYGQEHEISLYRLLRGDRRQQQSNADPVVGDPEFQEYQEWKRWREFQAYQKWKAEQEQAPTSSSSEGS